MAVGGWSPSDKDDGMTLISDNVNIPSWKKSKIFLQKHSNIIIEWMTEEGINKSSSVKLVGRPVFDKGKMIINNDINYKSR